MQWEDADRLAVDLMLKEEEQCSDHDIVSTLQRGEGEPEKRGPAPSEI